jgi:hypothetical protein
MKNFNKILAHNSFAFTLFTLASLLVFNACKKQDDDHHNHNDENELITTVQFMFVDSLSSDTLNFEWSQPGGAGTAITVDTIALKANSVYYTSVTLLDKSKTPEEDISEEIEADANSHRFVYSCSLVGTSIQILDFDQQIPPMELGLKFRFHATNIGGGTLMSTLKHYTTEDPKTGGISAGSTDLEVSFPLVVK